METRKVLNITNQGRVTEMLIWATPEFASKIVNFTDEVLEIERYGAVVSFTTHQIVFDMIPEKLMYAGIPLNILLNGDDINGTTYKLYRAYKDWIKNNK